MVFGFGFNKTKVLASAERNVKQGKLQNAIADYEKVLAEDPKDLTVMNTLGDLYARVGNTEKATEYFRKIGDAYAAEGFTVRAIAMYKKLTKQNPSATDAVLKLGDLYSQQGLYNDARTQYMQVAEHSLRNNELQQAAAVFQKTLELDPENSSLQTRLAELYVKIGRAAEARDLYFRNAEALRARGALDLADDALGRVIALDPNFGPALQTRGIVKFDSGDPEGAIHILEQLPDVDSRPDALRTLLKAHLAQGNVDSAEPIARKLLQVYSDASGIAGFGEALIAAGAYDRALAVFVEQAGVLLAANQPGFMQTLQSLTARMKTNARALEQLLEIFKRAGSPGVVTEVTELLAHAYVQEGELAKARDYYQKLTQLEPENPQHAQNYRQIASKIADVTPAPAKATAQHQSAIDSAAAEFDDDINTTGSAPEESFPISQIEQKYPGDLGELIEAALTDAELFDSYNLASKAIAPLEILLPRVPSDVRMNQRLASLYARSGRLKEAAERCDILEEVHVAAGFLTDSRFYAELAAKYRQRAGLPTDAPKKAKTSAQAATKPRPAAQVATPPPSATAPRSAPVPVTPPVPTPPPAAQVRAATTQTARAAAASAAPVVPSPAPPNMEPEAHEIDLSSEWEQMCEVEEVEPEATVATAAPVAAPSQPASVSSWDDTDEAGDPVAELLDEVRFYVSQSMWPEARTALSRCALIAPAHPEVQRLQSELAPSQADRNFEKQEVDSDFEIAGFNVEEDSPESEQFESTTLDPLLMTTPATDTVSVEMDPALESAPAPFAEPEQEVTVEQLETVTPSSEEPPTVPTKLSIAAQATSVTDLDAFVHDLEESLGDFELAAEQEPKSPAPPSRVVSSTPAVAGPPSVPSHPAEQIAPAGTPAAKPTPVETPVPAIAAKGAETEPTVAISTITEEEERNALQDIFSEFKDSVEGDAEAKEDPETHYNLGIAFKEMDLFDEAIGEFQKVCQAIDRGFRFGQAVQTYTWLADCFLKKGIPDLAVRWYEKALKWDGIDLDTDTAIRYELASACETAGDKQGALKHFMEVYGTNIDYRDVAERIKSLRS